MAYDIKDMQELARLYNGKCLGKEYIDQYSPLKWMCSRGHTWEIGVYQIKRGFWCVQCLKEDEKKTRLEEIKLFAKKIGFECLSKEYINSDEKLIWKCSYNHIWNETIGNFRNRKTCLLCKKEAELAAKLQQMKSIAVKRRGKCLSLSYVNNHTNLIWQCNKGHIWHATPHNVVDSNSWCMVCSGKAKHTIEEMQLLAISKGGKCLSSQYKNGVENLKWQCSKNHVWKTAPFNVLAGSWCNKCALERSSQKQRASISEVKMTARSRGGKLLSENYINSGEYLKWQCGKGHIWQARYTDVKHHSSWCPVCAREKTAFVIYSNLKPYGV